MANTTNYNWETPDDTDLVKDGAAAIRTLGSSIDTTTKNLNPQTTTGALAYRSATANVNTALPIGTAGQILAVSGGVPAWIDNDQGDITAVQAGVGISVASGTGPIPVITNSSTDLITTAGDLLYGTAADTVARLGIGTAGQVLKVNSGATAPEWGAAGGGSGLTLITNATLSSGTNNINSCFSATYKTYLIVLTITNMGSGANIRFRLRASGTDATTNYKLQSAQFTSTTVSTQISANTDFWQFGNADPTKAFFIVDLMNPFESDTTFAFAKSLTGTAGAYTDPLLEYPGAYNTNATSYDGITIYSHNGQTITGNARIYGRADS